MSRSGSACVDARDARRVGAALEVRACRRSRAPSPSRVGDRRRVGELRHPHERGFAAELEVHAEIGDERGRAHVERLAARRAAPRRASGSRARPRRSPPAAAECRPPRTPWRRRAWAPRCASCASPLVKIDDGVAVALDDPLVVLVVVLAVDLVGAREPPQPRRRSASRRRGLTCATWPGIGASRGRRARHACPAASARRCARSPAAAASRRRAARARGCRNPPANLASGGFSSVRTRNGNERAFASARPASSFRSVGNLDAELRLLGQTRTEASRSRCRRPRPSAASPGTPCPPRRRGGSSARPPCAIGAVNDSVSGRIGMHCASLLTRSQVNDARNAGRTVNASACVVARRHARCRRDPLAPHELHFGARRQRARAGKGHERRIGRIAQAQELVAVAAGRRQAEQEAARAARLAVDAAARAGSSPRTTCGCRGSSCARRRSRAARRSPR